MALEETQEEGENINWQVEITPLRHPYLWLVFVNGGVGDKFNPKEEIRCSLAGHQSSAIASALLAAASTAIDDLSGAPRLEMSDFWLARTDTALLDCGHRHKRLQMSMHEGKRLSPFLRIATTWAGFVRLTVKVLNDDNSALREVEFFLTVPNARLLAMALLSGIGEVRYDVGQ